MFQAGDTVRLKLQGSPPMMVEWFNDTDKVQQDGLGQFVSPQTCRCCWFDKDNRLQRQSFSSLLLEQAV